MREELKRRTEHFRSVDGQKIQRQNAWKESFQRFKNKELENGCIRSMEAEAACRIVKNGVDVSSIRFLQKKNWIQIVLLWLITFIAFHGTLENSYDAIKGVALIIIIVMCWSLWDIIICLNRAVIMYSSYISSAVRIYCGSIADVSAEEEQSWKKKLNKQLLHTLFGKAVCAFLVVFISVCTLSGYLWYWSLKKAVFSGLLGIPLTVLTAVVAYCIFKRKEANDQEADK